MEFDRKSCHQISPEATRKLQKLQNPLAAEHPVWQREYDVGRKEGYCFSTNKRLSRCWDSVTH